MLWFLVVLSVLSPSSTHSGMSAGAGEPRASRPLAVCISVWPLPSLYPRSVLNFANELVVDGGYASDTLSRFELGVLVSSLSKTRLQRIKIHPANELAPWRFPVSLGWVSRKTRFSWKLWGSVGSSPFAHRRFLTDLAEVASEKGVQFPGVKWLKVPTSKDLPTSRGRLLTCEKVFPNVSSASFMHERTLSTHAMWAGQLQAIGIDSDSKTSPELFQLIQAQYPRLSKLSVTVSIGPEHPMFQSPRFPDSWASGRHRKYDVAGERALAALVVLLSSRKDSPLQRLDLFVRITNGHIRAEYMDLFAAAKGPFANVQWIDLKLDSHISLPSVRKLLAGAKKHIVLRGVPFSSPLSSVEEVCRLLQHAESESFLGDLSSDTTFCDRRSIKEKFLAAAQFGLSMATSSALSERNTVKKIFFVTRRGCRRRGDGSWPNGSTMKHGLIYDPGSNSIILHLMIRSGWGLEKKGGPEIFGLHDVPRRRFRLAHVTFLRDPFFNLSTLSLLAMLRLLPRVGKKACRRVTLVCDMAPSQKECSCCTPLHLQVTLNHPKNARLAFQRTWGFRALSKSLGEMGFGYMKNNYRRRGTREVFTFVRGSSMGETEVLAPSLAAFGLKFLSQANADATKLLIGGKFRLALKSLTEVQVAAYYSERTLCEGEDAAAAKKLSCALGLNNILCQFQKKDFQACFTRTRELLLGKDDDDCCFLSRVQMGKLYFRAGGYLEQLLPLRPEASRRMYAAALKVDPDCDAARACLERMITVSPAMKEIRQ